jgi:arabinoxylan arabinofuranohydrolase
MNKLEFAMKRAYTLLLIMVTVSLFAVSEARGEGNLKENAASSARYIYQGAGNPYLPLWEHLPDGEPRVFEDPDNPGKYRAYIIGSHDVRFTSYCGPDIRMWSAPVENLSEWRDEGPIFTHYTEGQWDVMYAPDLVEVKRKDGTKEYYLYPHSRGRHREAMVAKGARPDGPFTPINLTDDGTRTVPGSIMGFDPAVYIEYVTDPNDPDFEIGFRAYGFWGFQRSLAAQLDQNTMYSLRPGTEIINYLLPASSRYGVIRDPQGTVYPNVYSGQDLGTFNFFEASSIRKVGNKYITVFSGYSGPEYGVSSSNSTLRYAFGDSPLGPWKSGGVLVDSRAPVLNHDGSAIQTSNSGHNTHGSIELINGQWYVFYHRPPRGFGFARQPMVAPITIEWDEKPVAEGGNLVIRAYDPYAKDQLWTAKDSQGNEYKGAEVTSEGFHFFGLNPYQYYSAGFACYLSDTRLQQDSWDIWDNHMPISDVMNGNIIGYKYFGFGGLDADKNGLKAFEGTKKGNNTAFNLFLTPKTSSTFKVNVWLNGPWDNTAWQGKKIGEIVVPANSTQETTKFTIDVSKVVDNLDKKHAVYLVAESDDTGELFDLIGLGFSADKKQIERPFVPTVSIAVNGKAIEVPATPVRSTNANGIVGYDLYEAKVTLPSNTNQIPVVSASANNETVNVTVTQAESTSGTALVKCDYKGIVKTYNIVFTTE